MTHDGSGPPDGGAHAPDARFGARAILAALALALVAVPFGLLLALVEGRWAPLRDLDASVRDELHAYALSHEWLVSGADALDVIGSARVNLPLLGLVALWLVWRDRPRLAAFVAITAALSPLLNRTVKALVDRARPALPDPVAVAGGSSFPSGHAQSAVVVYGVLLLVFLPLLRGRWRIAAFVGAAAMVLAIGFSRLALGVHYLSDVLAGYVLGAAWVAAMTAAFQIWRRERGRPPADASEGLEPGLAERAG